MPVSKFSVAQKSRRARDSLTCTGTKSRSPQAASDKIQLRGSSVRQKFFCALMLVLWGVFFGARVPAKESAEPKTGPVLKSVFPLGGNPGSRFEAVVRGENLEGAYAVWLDCSRLHAEIKEVREVELDKSEEDPDDAVAKKESEKGKKSYAVVVGVQIDPAADIGAHRLRLVTPAGV